MYEAICMQIQTLRHCRRKSSNVTDEMPSRRLNELPEFDGAWSAVLELQSWVVFRENLRIVSIHCMLLLDWIFCAFLTLQCESLKPSALKVLWSMKKCFINVFVPRNSIYESLKANEEWKIESLFEFEKESSFQVNLSFQCIVQVAFS